MKRQGTSFLFNNLTKVNVWTLEVKDILLFCKYVESDNRLRESFDQYMNLIKTAFYIENLTSVSQKQISNYEADGYEVTNVKLDNNQILKLGFKKRSINHISDLTKDNIYNLSANKLIKILDSNFGGGWESLSNSVQSIILLAFDISTTTLPSNRLKKKGGLYDKKVEAGYEVLEINKGAWTEAIFVKKKVYDDIESLNTTKNYNQMQLEDENDFPTLEDDKELDEDAFDEDKMVEESYRTQIDSDPESIDIESVDLTDDEY